MYSDARTHMHASAVMYTHIHADRVNMHSESFNYVMQTVNGVLRISLVIVYVFLIAAKCREKTKTLNRLILRNKCFMCS